MKIKDKFKKNIDGFTLIEVMVVLAIIGILASLIVPNLTGRADQARIIAAKQDIMSIDQALSLYKLDNATIPTAIQNLNSLVKKPLIEPIPENWSPSGYLKKIPFDPWGNDYIYNVLEDGYSYEIISLGADRKIGGEGINADINSQDF
jgi:general secretion pathway protein G